MSSTIIVCIKQKQDSYTRKRKHNILMWAFFFSLSLSIFCILFLCLVRNYISHIYLNVLKNETKAITFFFRVMKFWKYINLRKQKSLLIYKFEYKLNIERNFDFYYLLLLISLSLCVSCRVSQNRISYRWWCLTG